MVDELLQDSLQSLDAIVVSLGPGSFTGIRIGLGVVQGLSYGAGLPVVGLSTLEILALQAAQLSTGQILLPALDARMGEVYWAAYKPVGDRLEQAHRATVSAPSDMAAALRESFAGCTLLACGHGWGLPDLDDFNVEQSFAELKPRAEDALVLAEQKIMDHGLNHFPIGVVEPLYLRNEVSWQKRKRIRQ